MPVDLSKFAVGGATRPDSFSGMNPDFATALQQMFAAAPPDIQAQLRVGSGYRSPQRQAELWAGALQKYGSPEAARKWVAPPGRSNHNHGQAADLKYLNDSARAWAHQNAGQFGLAFPLANENWHVELASARGGKPHQHAPAPQAAPRGPSAPLPIGSAPAAPGPQSLGDLVAPQQAAPADFGSVVASMLQNKQGVAAAQAEKESAENARRTALLSTMFA